MTQVKIKQAKMGIFSPDEFRYPIHCEKAAHHGAAEEQESDLPPSAAGAGAGSVSWQAQPGATHLPWHSLTCWASTCLTLRSAWAMPLVEGRTLGFSITGAALVVNLSID